VSKKINGRFNRQFDRLERDVPRIARNVLRFLRHPYARLVRIPLGFLLVVGGIFSILPVLGLWMLPLGLLLLAVDIPLLRGPVGHLLVRIRTWWRSRRRK